MQLVRRIKWKRLAAIAVLGGLVIYTAIGFVKVDETELITYQKEVASGDTVWSICSKIATDKEDMGRLVWQTMQDNHIEDPGNLQPGMLVIVKVKEARNEKV